MSGLTKAQQTDIRKLYQVWQTLQKVNGDYALAEWKPIYTKIQGGANEEEGRIMQLQRIAKRDEEISATPLQLQVHDMIKQQMADILKGKGFIPADYEAWDLVIQQIEANAGSVRDEKVQIILTSDEDGILNAQMEIDEGLLQDPDQSIMQIEADKDLGEEEKRRKILRIKQVGERRRIKKEKRENKRGIQNLTSDEPIRPARGQDLESLRRRLELEAQEGIEDQIAYAAEHGQDAEYRPNEAIPMTYKEMVKKLKINKVQRETLTNMEIDEKIKQVYGLISKELTRTIYYPMYNWTSGDTLRFLGIFAKSLIAGSWSEEDLQKLDDGKSFPSYKSSSLFQMDIQKLNSNDYINFVDTAKSIFPDLSSVDTHGNYINPTMTRISHTYNLVKNPQKTEIPISPDQFASKTGLKKYLEAVKGQLQQGNKTQSEIDDKLNSIILDISNHPTILNYLKNKTLSSEGEEMRWINLNIQQEKIHQVYEDIKDTVDFQNEPILMQMIKERTELYNLKKQITANKNTMSLTWPLAPLDTQEVQTARFTTDSQNIYAMYINFSNWSKVEKKDAKITVAIQTDPTIPAKKLFEYTKHNEARGITIKAKAYPYYINSLGAIFFEQRTQNVILNDGTTSAQNVQSIDTSKLKTNINTTWLVSVSGYKGEFRIDFKIYYLKPDTGINIPFLKSPQPMGKLIQLLDSLSKLNFKIQKYRERIAKRLKYGHLNEETRMVDTVMSHLGVNKNNQWGAKRIKI